MRRCPVEAWEGWTTKRDVHEDSERDAAGRPNLIPSVAIERRPQITGWLEHFPLDVGHMAYPACSK
jgi:hypothetical protein